MGPCAPPQTGRGKNTECTGPVRVVPSLGVTACFPLQHRIFCGPVVAHLAPSTIAPDFVMPLCQLPMRYLAFALMLSMEHAQPLHDQPMLSRKNNGPSDKLHPLNSPRASAGSFSLLQASRKRRRHELFAVSSEPNGFAPAMATNRGTTSQGQHAVITTILSSIWSVTFAVGVVLPHVVGLIFAPVWTALAICKHVRGGQKVPAAASERSTPTMATEGGMELQEQRAVISTIKSSIWPATFAVGVVLPHVVGLICAPMWTALALYKRALGQDDRS